MKSSFLRQRYHVCFTLIVIFLFYLFVSYTVAMHYAKRDFAIPTTFLMIVFMIISVILVYLVYLPKNLSQLFQEEYLERILAVGFLMPLPPAEIGKHLALYVVKKRLEKQRKLEAVEEQPYREQIELEEKEHKDLEKRYMEHMLSQSNSKYDELAQLADLKGILSEEE